MKKIKKWIKTLFCLHDWERSESTTLGSIPYYEIFRSHKKCKRCGNLRFFD